MRGSSRPENLAKLYGTVDARIRQNFYRNESRFVEGKHFLKVNGEGLRNLRVSSSDSQISPKARSLVLWTERGAMRHAKMLETDQAWEVFETLEDCYFSARAKAKEDSARSTVRDRYPLYGFAVDTVLRHHLMFSKVYMLLNLFAGSRKFKDMTKIQVKEVAEFCDRFAAGQDTRADWLRIQENQVKLLGESCQVDFVQLLLVGDTRQLEGLR